MTSANGKIAVSESVVCAELSDEAVLLDVATGVYYGLDPVGTRIWRLLADGLGETEVVDRLLAEYGVEPDQLRSDVSEFVALLVTKGLVRGVQV